MTRKQITSLLLLAASVAYDIIPTDFIPDIPMIGWFDDALVTSSAAINCLQQFELVNNETAQKVLKWMKWICLFLAVLIILVVILLASTIISVLK